MVTLEYFSRINPKRLLSIIKMVHDEFPQIKYEEYLDKQPQNKYQYYLDNISFGGAYIQVGKYTNYDKMTKTFDILPMFQLRVNPNKHMNEPFFRSLLSKLLSVSGGGYLKKYDYAIDIPCSPEFVKVFDSRKEKGLFKGTRYYGQSGRHGYLKVYDKQKDLLRYNEKLLTPLTRVEYTLMTNKPISLDNVYLMQNNSLKLEIEALSDTDKAIVEMYSLLKLNNIDYELNVGRRKFDKLKEYISGQYALLEYGFYLDSLLVNVKNEFGANEINPLFNDYDDDILTHSVCMIQDNEPELLFD